MTADYGPPQEDDPLTIYNREGKTIGRIRSFRCYVGNFPTIEVVVDWHAIDEIMDALRR